VTNGPVTDLTPAMPPTACLTESTVDETGWELPSSGKQGAAPTFKGRFGCHPILVFLDNTREALAGILRPGIADPTSRPITSRSSMPRWPRSPTSTVMAPRSWCAPIPQAAPRHF
jgi:hypothetical protein